MKAEPAGRILKKRLTMKRKYTKPVTTVIKLSDEPVMIASSIQNIENDVQHGIDKNDADDFEAGAKDHKNWGDLWDE